MAPPIEVHHLGLCEYTTVLARMRDYTDSRDSNSADQIWVLEHEPVYTQGYAGKAEHILRQNAIPIVPVDRGGQVTYHGPGQIVIYPLIDIARRHLGIRALVTLLEQAMIALLHLYDIAAYSDPKRPGVYVDEAKIGAVGLRIRKGCSYHGLSFNVNLDLSPYQNINPCGYANMPITKLSAFVPDCQMETVKSQIISILLSKLKATHVETETA